MTIIDSLKRIISEGGAWLFFGHALTVIGQLAFFKLVAVTTSVQVFGQVGLVMGVVAAINTFLYGPLTQWALRHYQEFQERQRQAEFATVILACVLFGAVLLVAVASVLLVSAPRLHDLHGGETLFQGTNVVLALAFGMLVCLNDLLSSLFNAAARSRISTLFYILSVWLRVAAVLAAAMSGHTVLSAILWYLVIGQIALLATQGSLIFRIGKVRLKLQFEWKSLCGSLRKMARYVYPFVIWSIPAYFVLMGDRWILARHVDAVALGSYIAMVTVTFGLSNAMSIAFNRAVVPVLFRVSGSGEVAQRRRAAQDMVRGLAIVLCIANLLLAGLDYIWPERIITLFSSGSFTIYADQLWLLMLAATAFNLGQFLITHGLVEKDPSRYLLIKFVSGLLIIALLLPSVYLYGVTGAVYAVLVVNVIQLLLVHYVNHRAGLYSRRSILSGN